MVASQPDLKWRKKKDPSVQIFCNLWNQDKQNSVWVAKQTLKWGYLETRLLGAGRTNHTYFWFLVHNFISQSHYPSENSNFKRLFDPEFSVGNSAWTGNGSVDSSPSYCVKEYTHQNHVRELLNLHYKGLLSSNSLGWTGIKDHLLITEESIL